MEEDTRGGDASSTVNVQASEKDGVHDHPVSGGLVDEETKGKGGSSSARDDREKDGIESSRSGDEAVVPTTSPALSSTSVDEKKEVSSDAGLEEQSTEHSQSETSLSDTSGEEDQSTESVIHDDSSQASSSKLYGKVSDMTQNQEEILESILEEEDTYNIDGSIASEDVSNGSMTPSNASEVGEQVGLGLSETEEDILATIMSAKFDDDIVPEHLSSQINMDDILREIEKDGPLLEAILGDSPHVEERSQSKYSPKGAKSSSIVSGDKNEKSGKMKEEQSQGGQDPLDAKALTTPEKGLETPGSVDKDARLSVETEKELEGGEESADEMSTGLRPSVQTVAVDIATIKKLKEISGTLVQTKLLWGCPHAFCVLRHHVFVGMTRGVVVQFTDEGARLGVFSPTMEGVPTEFGPVHSLDVSLDGKWLVVGYDSFQVAVFDVTAGKLEKLFPALHNFSIVNVRIVDSDSPQRLQFISIDAKGVGYVTVMRRNFLRQVVFDHHEVFAGNADPRQRIVSASILRKGTKEHLSNSFGIFAAAFRDSCGIYLLHPIVKKLATIEKSPEIPSSPSSQSAAATTSPSGNDGEDSAVCVCWRPVLGSPGGGIKRKTLEPIVTVSFGRQVRCFQCHMHRDRMRVDGSDEVIVVTDEKTHEHVLASFHQVAHFTTKSEVVGMQWINERVLVFVTKDMELRVADPYTMEEFQCVSVRDLQLVRPSVKMPGVPSSQGAMQTCEELLYLLGMQSLHTVKVKTWRERVNDIASEGRYDAALRAALSFFNGTAKAVVGLSRNAGALKRETGDEIKRLVQEYVSQIEERPDRAKSIIRAVQHYSLSAELYSFLFNDLYARVCSLGRKEDFLELLPEQLKLHERVFILPKGIVDDLFEYLHYRGNLPLFEECILSTLVDKESGVLLLELFREHCLLRGIAYVHCHGAHDYVSPFSDILMRLRKPAEKHGETSSRAEKKKMSEEIRFFFKYLRRVWKGHVFPGNGTIQPSVLVKVKEEIVRLLLEGNGDDDDAFFGKKKFGRLRQMLLIDVPETFNFLSRVFDDGSETSLWGKRIIPISIRKNPRSFDVGTNGRKRKKSIRFDENLRDYRPTEKVMSTMSPCRFSRQDIVNALLETMVDPSSKPFMPGDRKWTWPLLSDLTLCFVFVARYIVAEVLTFDAETIHRTFAHVMMQTSLSLEERETLLIGVLRSVEKRDDLNLREMIKISIQSGAFAVAAELHDYLGDLGGLIDACLSDSRHMLKAFDMIRERVMRQDVDQKVVIEMQETVLKRVDRLVMVDEVETGKLLLDCFPINFRAVLKALSRHERVQYLYLSGLIAQIDPSGINMSSSGIDSLPDDVHESYIRLLCKFSPKKVYNYLSRNENYRLDFCLDVCREFKIHEAVAYLRERMGDVTGALTMMIKEIGKKLIGLKKRVNALEIAYKKANGIFVEELGSDAQDAGVDSSQGKSDGMEADRHSFDISDTEHDSGDDDDDDELEDGRGEELERIGKPSDGAGEGGTPGGGGSASRDGKVESGKEQDLSGTKRMIPGQPVTVEKLRMMKRVRSLYSSLEMAIDLCKRNSPRLDEQETEKLWFSLLDRFVDMQRRLQEEYDFLGSGRARVELETELMSLERSLPRIREAKRSLEDELAHEESDTTTRERWLHITRIYKERGMRAEEIKKQLAALEGVKPTMDMDANRKFHAILSEAIQDVLLNMSTYVRLYSILNKIVHEHGRERWGQFRQTIVAMLENSRYETVLLQTANKLIAGDSYRLADLYVRLLKSSYRLMRPPRVETPGIDDISSLLEVPSAKKDGEEDDGSGRGAGKAKKKLSSEATRSLKRWRRVRDALLEENESVLRGNRIGGAGDVSVCLSLAQPIEPGWRIPDREVGSLPHECMLYGSIHDELGYESGDETLSGQ